MEADKAGHLIEVEDGHHDGKLRGTMKSGDAFRRRSLEEASAYFAALEGGHETGTKDAPERRMRRGKTAEHHSLAGGHVKRAPSPALSAGSEAPDEAQGSPKEGEGSPKEGRPVWLCLA